jgi:hypothetical protein
MYADLWVPPVVTLEIAGVAVPSADVSRAKTASPADHEQVVREYMFFCTSTGSFFSSLLLRLC